MRTDTDTVVMPHEMLGALFGSVPAPRLRLLAIWFESQPQPGAPRLMIYLRNDGPGTARSPILILDIFSEQDFDLGHGSKSAANLTSSGTSGAFMPIHFQEILYPGTEDMLAALFFGRTFNDRPRTVRMRGQLCAIDAMPTPFDETIEFVPEEVVSIPRVDR